LLSGQTLEAHTRFDNPLHRVRAQAGGQFLPLRRLEHDATVRHRHAVTVHGVEMRGDPSVRTELRVQMTHELVAVHVKVDPVGGTAPLGAAERLAIELTRFADVADLKGDMKWRKHNERRTPAPALPQSIAGRTCGAAGGRGARSGTGLLLGLLGLCAAAAVNADTALPPEPATFLSLGPAVEITPTYPGAPTSRTFALPDVEAQYENWLYTSATDLLGVYAYNHQGDKAGAAIEYDFTERLEKDSPRFTHLGDVNTTTRFKLFVEQRVAMFSGGVNVATDIGGHNEGTVAQAFLNLLLPLTARGFLTVGPGVTWSDTHYMRAFFGVSPEQSALSGLPQFTAHQGISDVHGELVAGYELSSRWALGLDVTVARLEGDAADSPFTETRTQTTWLASVLYKFR
jgi:MipA family protein